MKSRLLLFVLFVVMSGVSAAQPDGDITEVRTRSKKQGYLGVSIQDVTPKFAREKGLKVKEGAFVNDVVDDSPADSAGIKEGDIVTEFNGTKIELAEDLSQAVRKIKPGTKVSMKLNRGGENKTISLSIGKSRMRTPMAYGIPHAPRVIVNLFGNLEGMELMDLNKQLAEYFEAPNGLGVLVKEVQKKSNAEKSGIKAGDVIIKIGTENISDIDDLRDALYDLDEGDKATVEILRKGKKSSVSLEIAERNDEPMYWKGNDFNFHVEPRLERLYEIQKNLELKLKDLPLKEKEIKRIQMKEREAEV